MSDCALREVFHSQTNSPITILRILFIVKEMFIQIFVERNHHFIKGVRLTNQTLSFSRLVSKYVNILAFRDALFSSIKTFISLGKNGQNNEGIVLPAFSRPATL